MAATRKLQAEIDRCLKKVAEGVDKFEETWQKVHNATNTNQKEKYEEDLKKEIKKLQRLRDQIKTWIASPDVKDKAVLMDKRKLIEQQMERFKVVERETKTKAYSKEGLTSGTKLDPAEKERYEISQWLNQQLHSLNLQIDQFEAEIESLAGAKKKKNKNSNEDKIEEYKTLLEKHRDHVQKLETLLRMLDNDTVDINQIKDIKEDVEYYIENCQEDDFTENEMIYEDIDGLEEMLLDLSNIGGHEHNTNSVDASETMSTNSASSPVPSAGPASTHNHSNDLTSATDEKRRHKSSSDDSKTTVVGNANNSTSSVGIPAAKVQPNNASKPNAVNSLSSSSGITTSLASAPKSTTSSKSFATPNNSSPSSGLPNHVPPPQSPSIVTQQQPNFAAAVAAQQNGHASSDHGVVRSSTPPHVSHALPGTIPPSSQAFSALPPNQQSNNLPPISRPSASDSMSLKSLAQATLDQQLSQQQQPQQQTSQSQTSSQPPVGTAPSISQPGLFSTSGQKELKTDSSSAAVTAHIPPLLGVAPLGPVALNKDTQYQYTMLDAAYAHMPHPSDSEKLRPYLPRNPCPTPAYYPQLPPSGSDTIEFFQRLSTETLFFIFYYMEGTNAQFLAAKALKKQSWRFHTKYMMWFQRHEEPKIINDEYEQGTYIYFDFEKWGQRKKEGFTFEYRFLEDRELN